MAEDIHIKVSELEARVEAMERELDELTEEFDRALDRFAELSAHTEVVQKYLSSLEELMRLIAANQLLDETGVGNEDSNDAKQ